MQQNNRKEPTTRTQIKENIKMATNRKIWCLRLGYWRDKLDTDVQGLHEEKLKI